MSGSGTEKMGAGTPCDPMVLLPYECSLSCVYIGGVLLEFVEISLAWSCRSVCHSFSFPFLSPGFGSDLGVENRKEKVAMRKKS